MGLEIVKCHWLENSPYITKADRSVKDIPCSVQVQLCRHPTKVLRGDESAIETILILAGEHTTMSPRLIGDPDLGFPTKGLIRKKHELDMSKACGWENIPNLFDI
jgi:hypothetical protein